MNAGPQRERIRDRCREVAGLPATANPVASGDVGVMDDILAPGYGRLNPPKLEPGRLFLLVYTGGTPVAAAGKPPLLWAASYRRRPGNGVLQAPSLVRGQRSAPIGMRPGDGVG